MRGLRGRVGRRVRVALVSAVLLVAVLAGLGVAFSPRGSTAPATAPVSSASTTLLGSAVPRATTPTVDDAPAELGVRFSVQGAGRLVGLRYFRGPSDRVVHEGRLWNASRQVLAVVEFPASSVTGWQYVAFRSPVATTRATYVASYHTAAGYLSETDFFSQERTTGKLSASASAGVFRYGDGPVYPDQSFRQTNYWVDPVFTTSTSGPFDGPPSAAPSGPAPASSSSTAPAAPSSGTTAATPSTRPVPPPDLAEWPDASNTGVVGCPPLEKIRGQDQIVLRDEGLVYENKEIYDSTIRVLAHDVTIRCVKVVGTGWFGIQNSERPSPKGSATDVVVDRVEVDCRDKGFVVGMLLKGATVSRANVHGCDHMVNAGGDDLVVKDSYCHDLTQIEGKDIHADCVQSLGGNTNLTIRHNSLWGWGTSDILLGQEYGEVRNAVIDSNRLLSDPDQLPAPAYLFYVSGSSTVVTNNRFTRRSTYGPCTLNTAAEHVRWSGNVWDEDGTPVRLSDC